MNRTNNDINELDSKKIEIFTETVRRLPENYQNMLIGAAFALEMSTEIGTPQELEKFVV